MSQNPQTQKIMKAIQKKHPPSVTPSRTFLEHFHHQPSPSPSAASKSLLILRGGAQAAVHHEAQARAAPGFDGEISRECW